jgi:hypothetical protein
MPSDHYGIKLEVNNRKMLKHTLHSTWVKEQLSREIFKHFGSNKSENTVFQNLIDAKKAVLTGKME